MKTEAAPLQDAKTEVFLGNKCLDFMRYETQRLQEWCLISAAPAVTPGEATAAQSHMAASLPRRKQDEAKWTTLVMTYMPSRKAEIPPNQVTNVYEKKKKK